MTDTGEVVTIGAEAIHTYYPRRFDQWGPDEQEALRASTQRGLIRIEPDSATTDEGFSQHIVVRGHELELDMVDSLGRYIAFTRDPHVGEALGLTSDGYRWKGWFRRSDIEQRYDLTEMVKIKGYWVELHGFTTTNHLPSVHTEDPDAARALGLKLRKPIVLDEDGEPTLDQKTPRWYGVVKPDDVEERRTVKTWHWPLPEVQVD